MKMPAIIPSTAFHNPDNRPVNNRWIISLACLLLSSCQFQESIRKEIPATPETISEPAQNPPVQTGLSPDLLYDILVADIARDREQPEFALDHLSRAAGSSMNRRLLLQATQLAMETKDYQQVVDLSRQLLDLEPDNPQIILIHAKGVFMAGDRESAMELTRDMILEQPLANVSTFREAANMLFDEKQPEILDEFIHFLGPDPPAGPGLTVAILAILHDRFAIFSSWIERTLELAPQWEEAAILKLTYLSSRLPDQVVPFARRHLDNYREHTAFRNQYAYFLMKNDRTGDSIAQYTETLKHSPRSERALFALGVLYLKQEKSEQARLMFERALVINKRNDETRLYLAQIAQDNLDYDEAIKYLRSVTLPDYYLEAQISLGWIYFELHGFSSGITYLDRVSAQTEEDRVSIILTQIQMYREDGLLIKARTALDEALERFPDNADLLYHRGMLLAQFGLLDLHEKDMRKLIALDPEYAHAYNSLGYTLADKTSRFDEAMELIVKANQLLPDNAFILDSLGWVHYRLGNMAMALKYLNQALEIQQDAEIAAHLGEVLWTIGQYQEARQIWSLGSQWEPDNPVLIDTLGRLDSEQTGEIVNHADPENSDHSPVPETQSSTLVQ